MKIEVNNKEMNVDSSLSLAQLAEQLQLSPQGIAVAVDNRMIPRTKWSEYILRENDAVVIIQAACGG